MRILCILTLVCSALTPSSASRAQVDQGVFDHFNGQIRTQHPSWLQSNAWPLSTASDWDDDSIDNQSDILRGTKKADINDAPYGSPYQRLSYPGGDVPKTEGVCTDVVIRSLRNAGLDLQKDLYEDIVKRPSAFPMVKRPNRNIDHRRVKTLLPYFQRHHRSLPTNFVGNERSWAPGDVLFMQLFGDGRPDHVGIVSDRLGASGQPLVINNWAPGYRTDELDVLPLAPVTHRFRVERNQSQRVPKKGLEGIVQQTGVILPPNEQLVVVTADSKASSTAELRLLEKRGAKWVVVFGPKKVALGRSGLRVKKREGDGASPAGVFALGAAFGTDERPRGFKGKYRKVKSGDRWVDDPKSEHYNRWVGNAVPKDWSSAEDLSQYDLAMVIAHNLETPVAGHGSAIFLHTTDDTRTPTAGCTALKKPELKALLRKLDVAKKPFLVQVVADWHP